MTCSRDRKRTRIAFRKVRSVKGHIIALLTSFALLASAQASAGPAQFDLQCQGTREELDVSDDKPKSVDTRFQKTVRIDISAGKWCEGACREIQPIRAVLEDNIWLLGTDNEIISVNRSSADYLRLYSTEGVGITEKLSCVVASFTPFPARQF
jgi:hypothetical protein